MKTFYTIWICFILMASSLSVSATGIQVSNVELAGQNILEGSITIQFDISWNNSWRVSSGPRNWDAAWVFIKYRETAGGEWQHGLLHGSDHVVPDNCVVDVGLLDPGEDFNEATNPGMGVFLYRSSDGGGEFTATGVQLRWNYGATGVPDDAMLDLRVFAIEMVYVPGGNFFLGSGSSSESSRFHAGGQANTVPFQVTGEWNRQVGSSAGMLWAVSSINSGQLDSGFPSGYEPFYIMKYPVSQRQYVEFLNKLTREQQELVINITTEGRYIGNSSSPPNRNGIKLVNDPGQPAPRIFDNHLSNTGPFNGVSDGQWIACNYIGYIEGAAFADWAGLRPYTELEYEKTARGPLSPVADEYVWGTTGVMATTGVNDSGMESESASNSGANANYGSHFSGPVRVGMYAGQETGRAQAGAGYYGVMELAGNLYEHTVTLATATGREFSGRHGDGQLSQAGNANIPGWPGFNASSGIVNATTGMGTRGGAWNRAATEMQTSDRNRVSTSYSSNQYTGFRAARTAPASADD